MIEYYNSGNERKDEAYLMTDVYYSNFLTSFSRMSREQVTKAYPLIENAIVASKKTIF